MMRIVSPTNALLLPLLLGSTAASKTIVGYYASWQWYDRQKLAQPSNLDFTKVQRVNFAFFQTNANGDLWGTDSWADPQVLFGPANWNPGAAEAKYCSWDAPGTKTCDYHKYNEGLISLAHAAGAEVYPSIGGWSLSSAFPAMAASPTSRTNFANKCVELIQDYGFDGIDIDWEFPGFADHAGTTQDKTNFSLLLEEVRIKLLELSQTTGKSYGLTAALPCGPENFNNIDISAVAKSLTELNLMTYDFHGAWDTTTGVNAPLYDQGWGPEGFSLDSCVKNWVGGGASPSRINIGVPFYGRSFRDAKGLNQPHGGSDTGNWPMDDGTPEYYNIQQTLSSMTSVRDETTKTQYAYFSSGGLVSFDDEQAVCDKTEYVVSNNLHGFIIWELSGDVMDDRSTPLLDTMNKKLADPSMSCGTGTPLAPTVPDVPTTKAPTPPSSAPIVPSTSQTPSPAPTGSSAPAAATQPTPAPTGQAPTPAAPIRAAPTPVSLAPAAAPTTSGNTTCGDGNRGNGVCSDPSLCCSQFGWCGTSAAHCETISTAPNPVPVATPPVTSPTPPTPTASTAPECPSSGSALIPSAQCKGFYHCLDGAVISDMIPCPDGTLFNKAVGVCDWSSNVHC
jgi:chitinase